LRSLDQEKTVAKQIRLSELKFHSKAKQLDWNGPNEVRRIEVKDEQEKVEGRGHQILDDDQRLRRVAKVKKAMDVE